MPFVKAENIVHKAFDYIVIGGGVSGVPAVMKGSDHFQTAGIPAAVRLTEHPSASVLVLEAGRVENLGDFKIDVPAQFGHTFGNPLV